MSRLVDLLSVSLLGAAGVAFVAALSALGARDDLRALYVAAVGVVALRASVDLLRPQGASGA